MGIELKNRRRWSFLVVAIFAIIVAAKLWQVRNHPEGTAPALIGMSMDGQPVSLADMLRTANGKPVLVTFWATWCTDCRAEEGAIQAISRDHPVLTVATQSEGDDAVAKYLKEHGLSFVTINDPDKMLAKAWKVGGIPVHFIVDSNGTVRARVTGSKSEWKLRARLWWVGIFSE